METAILSGIRRELTREVFEDLASLQCEPEEIQGYVGTTREQLEAWCLETYDHPLEEMLRMIRQDGLIQIRRASFEQLKKSATIVSQQYNRFLPAAGKGEDAGAESVARHFAALLNPPEEQVQELFE